MPVVSFIVCFIVLFIALARVGVWAHSGPAPDESSEKLTFRQAVAKHWTPIGILGVVAMITCSIAVGELTAPAPRPQTQQEIAAARVQQNQVALMQAVRDAAEAARKVEADHVKRLCEAKAACALYKDTREQCATAGNFDNCVRVKMGSEKYSLVDDCTEDGTVAYLDASKTPDAFSCFINRHQ